MRSDSHTLFNTSMNCFREIAAATISPPEVEGVELVEGEVTPLKPVPLCKDGLFRPYMFSIVVDVTARSPEKVILNLAFNTSKSGFAQQ